MRDLFLSILFPAALLWALYSAQGSILVLNWIWFQRPYDFSWGFWNSMPLFQIALAVAFFSNLLRGQLKLRFPLILIVYLGFLVWITLSTMFAFNEARAWEYYRTFLPSMWVAPVLLFATIRDLSLLKWVLWVAAGGIGLNAAKTAVSSTLSGGAHLDDQISGFVGDNNVFGLVLCLVVATLMGLRVTLPERTWARVLFYFFVGLIVLCIVYTKSRGALISLVLLFLFASLFSTRPVRHSLLVIVVAALGYLIVPSTYFERLGTLRELETDVSAMGRIENWHLAWEAAVHHPLLGVGPNNHVSYNKALFPEVQVRAAHSVYFQVLGELGFVGLFLFLWITLLVLRSLWKAHRLARAGPETSSEVTLVRSLSYWLLCGFGAYSVGAGLLNMLYIEFPWYLAFYGSMLYQLVPEQVGSSHRSYAHLRRETGRQIEGKLKQYGDVATKRRSGRSLIRRDLKRIVVGRQR